MPLHLVSLHTQARLRLNSFYNTVLVDRDSLWLFLFGAAGGAFSIFLQVRGVDEHQRELFCSLSCAPVLLDLAGLY
jgi:hypothetical protein